MFSLFLFHCQKSVQTWPWHLIALKHVVKKPARDELCILAFEIRRSNWIPDKQPLSLEELLSRYAQRWVQREHAGASEIGPLLCHKQWHSCGKPFMYFMLPVPCLS